MTSDASGVPTKIGNANPWTEYVKYLPAQFFLPTFWNGSEQELLKGTSLETALAAKLQSLDREFTLLRDATQPLECCRYWWDPDIGGLSFEDWKLVDAMYRSRAMDLPGTGLALVPCMDMANHASGDGCCALYETDESFNATLTLLPGQNIKKDDEVTISYGDEKGACEMLFSYGIIPDCMENAQSIFLDLDIPDDDPLRFAKKAAFDVAPGFRVYMYQGTTTWLGPFVWLQCINEEDGLEFQVLQTNEGDKELTVSWKGQVIRGIIELEDCIKNDRSFTLFQLRAVTVLQQRIQDQLSRLSTSNQKFEKLVKNSSELGPQVVEYASKLRVLENKLLYRASNDFDATVSLPAIICGGILSGTLNSKSICTIQMLSSSSSIQKNSMKLRSCTYDTATTTRTLIQTIMKATAKVQVTMLASQMTVPMSRTTTLGTATIRGTRLRLTKIPPKTTLPES